MVKLYKSKIYIYNITKVSDYIIAILLILSCHSLLGTMLGGSKLLALCIIGTGVALALRWKQKMFVKHDWLNPIAFYFLTLFLLLIFGDFKYLYFVATYIVLGGFLVIGFIQDSRKDFFYRIIRAFSNIVLIIATISIFFFVFGTLLHAIPVYKSYSAKYLNWSNFGYNNYYFLYNDGQYTDIFGKYILRNIGIFLEAPMYTFVLVIALYDCLFFRKKVNIVATIILTVTMITTLSTTAYVMAAGLITIRFFDRIRNSKALKTIIIPFFSLILIYFIEIVLRDKLSSTNLSGIARLDDIQASVRSFLAHPILGNGYNNARALDPFRTSYTKDIVRTSREAGQSTGMFAILSNGGIVYLSIWILPLLSAVVCLQNRMLKKINYQALFVILFNIMLFVTAVQTEYICVFLTVMCGCSAIQKFKDFELDILKLSLNIK